MPTVLLVDDEPRIAEIAGDYLRHAGFAVETVGTAAAALAAARRTPDLVVLDLKLPDRDGLEVARDLRRCSSIPIIMLTARSEESDRLIGLDAGADDYMVKPFSPRELVARVKAVLRRTGRGTGGELRLDDLVLDPARMTVTRGREVIELTATEFQLLATLVEQPGRVFTRGQLLDRVRGDEGESFDRAIDAHIKNLRRKLERDARDPRYILTVYGMGYKAAER